MKKGWIAGLTLICLLLGSGTAAVYMMGDRKGPEILFPDQEVTYTENGDTAALLEGVTAEDAADGDVSDTLLIEDIYENEDGTGASVIYVAKDRKNHVTKKTRKVMYQGSDQGAAQAQPVDTGSEEQQEPGKDSAEADSSTAEETGMVEESIGERNQKASEEQIASLPDTCPKLYLTEYETAISAGDDVNLLSFVKEITDDEDSREELFQNIQIEGDVDSQTPGDYTVTFHVADSNRNRSNDAVLTVHVQ